MNEKIARLSHIDYSGEALRALLGISAMGVSKRVANGWLPRGWRYKKVGNKHVFTALMIDSVPYYYDDMGLLTELPIGQNNYKKKKSFVAHNGRRRQGKK